MADLQRAYEVHKGQIEQIISDIPFATYEDEDRLIRAIQTLIDRQQLPLHPAFSRALKDTKGKERRRKQGKSEAKEAEQHARDLGLWDIFYGGATEQDLGALIKGRAGASHAQMMASLESKYGPAAKTASRKKRNIQALDLAGAMPSSDPAPPTDEEFDVGFLSHIYASVAHSKFRLYRKSCSEAPQAPATVGRRSGPRRRRRTGGNE